MCFLQVLFYLECPFDNNKYLNDKTLQSNYSFVVVRIFPSCLVAPASKSPNVPSQRPTKRYPSMRNLGRPWVRVSSKLTVLAFRRPPPQQKKVLKRSVRYFSGRFSYVFGLWVHKSNIFELKLRIYIKKIGTVARF